MTELRELHNEFIGLKKKLFGNDMFIVLDENSDDTKRYNVLLQLFYPKYKKQKEYLNIINQV